MGKLPSLYKAYSYIPSILQYLNQFEFSLLETLPFPLWMCICMYFKGLALSVFLVLGHETHHFSGIPMACGKHHGILPKKTPEICSFKFSELWGQNLILLFLTRPRPMAWTDFVDITFSIDVLDRSYVQSMYPWCDLLGLHNPVLLSFSNWIHIVFAFRCLYGSETNITVILLLRKRTSLDFGNSQCWQESEVVGGTITWLIIRETFQYWYLGLARRSLWSDSRWYMRLDAAEVLSTKSIQVQ